LQFIFYSVNKLKRLKIIKDYKLSQYHNLAFIRQSIKKGDTEDLAVIESNLSNDYSKSSRSKTGPSISEWKFIPCS